MQELAGKHIVLGLSGGIACYKSAELTRRLQDAGASVQVVMSEAATHFITPVTMQALSGKPVYTSQWDARMDNNMAHIDLTRSAAAILIAPASADLIAKLAHGQCDDLLTTLCLARDCALVVAPAMNRQMWANPATQRNIARLRADGIHVLGPAAGDQACGEVGLGRMLEPNDLVESMIDFFQPKPLRGQQVLVTAGPTFEAIDPVRGITNLSSGKMGYAIARAAREAGAEVILVSGPTALAAPMGVTRIDVRSARDMQAAVMAQVPTAQIFISVAAVADWRIANPSTSKLKKEGGGGAPALEFVQNPDILATVAALPNRPYCVGFAAETDNLDANAQSKRQRKNVPLLVGNIAQDALGADDNALILYDDAGVTTLERADKQTLARQLIAAIVVRLQGAGQ